MGDRVLWSCDRFHRQLHGAAAVRSSLSRRFFPRQGHGAATVGALSRRHRSACSLRDRRHVGWRPGRTLWPEPPARADRRRSGALVVWIAGDPTIMPVKLRSLAADAAIQPPLRLDNLRGGGSHTVGWAILLPKRSFARLKPPP